VTRARAPGKVVLSGAYAVLSGAPAIVAAVSRYVTADSARPAELITDEVRAALGEGDDAPYFDASALRQDGRKLGLGSSAAILVASLFALERGRDPSADAEALRRKVFERALVAHRKAQQGGSGVDVASCTFGGTLVYRLVAGGQELERVALPPGLSLEIWTCPTSASTRELLAAVERLGTAQPREHARWLGAQSAASVEAAERVAAGDAKGLLGALGAQYRALLGLGRAAGVPIVTSDLEALGPEAQAEGGVVFPAGAGGGDVAIFAGIAASSPSLRRALESRAHVRLETDLSAEGVSDD